MLSFNEASGMLSRDCAAAVPVNSGTRVLTDGSYWLALYDAHGRYVRSEYFEISQPAPQSVRNFSDFQEAVLYGLRHQLAQLSFAVSGDASGYTPDVLTALRSSYPTLLNGLQSLTINTHTYGDNTTMSVSYIYNFPLQRVRQMSADTSARARQIIASLARAGMRDYELERAVHDYIIAHARYDRAAYDKGAIPAVDYTDYGILVNGLGVCEGYANATNRLLNMLGVPALFVSGYANGGAHAWNIVFIQNEYCHLDTTFDDPYYQTGTSMHLLSHNYFNLSDSILGRDHQWDGSRYPRCSTMRYSYYQLGFTERDSYGNNYIVIQSQSALTDILTRALAERQANLYITLGNISSAHYDVNTAFASASARCSDQAITAIVSLIAIAPRSMCGWCTSS